MIYTTIGFNKPVAEIFFASFALRCPSADDLVILKQEAILCAKSCLQILKALVNSRCEIQLLLDCLRSIGRCISEVDNTGVLEKEDKNSSKQTSKIVGESFEVVKKWLKKKLLSKLPCCITNETEKELEVYACLLEFSSLTVREKIERQLELVARRFLFICLERSSCYNAH